MKERIRDNAAEIERLRSRVRETYAERSKSPKKKHEWEQACAQFHERYGSLAFPGGYGGALDRISSGNPEAMVAAICFLECRPYFFRSGYMFKDILRRCRRAPLLPEQAARLEVIEQKLLEWRARKLAKKRKRY
jgi:hypothetical protein